MGLVLFGHSAKSSKRPPELLHLIGDKATDVDTLTPETAGSVGQGCSSKQHARQNRSNITLGVSTEGINKALNGASRGSVGSHSVYTIKPS